MASDMVVVLAPATQDGRTLFGHNNNRPRGESTSLVHVPGRTYSSGERVQTSRLLIPQVRHTWTVLAGHSGPEWGFPHGVNEKGVAVGCTSIRTRLENHAPGFSGPDLVRLTLERAASACQAIEILTDLIGRHGQGSYAGEGSDSAFLVVDHQEACLLEATGRHWALSEVGSVRAATGVCLLRQDWDRISRGLSDLAISRDWWPEDGCKLDFAGALSQAGPDHAGNMRRWGQATLALEQHSGQIEGGFLRKLLAHQAELAATQEAIETSASLLVSLGPTEGDLPAAWYAFASPVGNVYLPVFPVTDLPMAYGDDPELGCRAWRMLHRWQREAREDPSLRLELETRLADLQRRLDIHVGELLPEARDLYRSGQSDALRRLTSSFVQHCWERFEEVGAAIAARPGEPLSPEEIEEQMVGAAF